MNRSKPMSPNQVEALEHARTAGGLTYVRGGYWVEKGVDSKAFLDYHWSDPERPWHTITVTVKALVRKGLLVWTDTSPGFPVQAEMPKEVSV